MDNFVQYLTETLVQTFDRNLVNADQRPLNDSVENQGWRGMYTLVVPSLSTKFIKNSHKNLPV